MRVDVLYVQYTNPANYPPLEHSSRILADAGLRVRFVGAQAAGGAARLTFPPCRNVRVDLLPYEAPGWRQKLHYGRFVLACVWSALRDRPRWVYASDFLACPPGWLASFLPGVRVIYHEHDTPSTGGKSARAVTWSRRRLARRAAACVLPQAERAERFAIELAPRRLMVVWNTPRRTEVAAPLPAPTPGRLVLWYHGSIVPSQFPEAVIRAVAMSPAGVSLRFAGYETLGAANYVERLLRLAGELGVADRVSYLGSIPTRRDLLAAAAACDVGLLPFARVFREPMAGASNKPFDYAACGLALVFPDTPEWDRLYGAAGCGVPCDPADPASLAAAFRHLLDDQAATRRYGEAGRRKLQTEWNYEAQFEPVAELIEG